MNLKIIMFIVFFVLIITCFARTKEEKIEKKLIKKVNKGIEIEKIYSELELLCKQYNIVKVKKLDIRKSLQNAAEIAASKIKQKIETEQNEIRRKRVETEMRQLRKDAKLVKLLRFQNNIESDKDALSFAKKTTPINAEFFKDSMKVAWGIKQRKLGIPNKKH